MEMQMIDKKFWKKFYGKKQIMPPSAFAAHCLKWFEKGTKILDAGCGDGRDSVFFAEKGYSVIAIDGASTVNIPGVLFYQDDISKLRDFPVDNVYCRFTLHSLTVEEESGFLDWCSDNIRSHGILAIEGRSVASLLFRKGVPGPDKNSKITDHYRRFIDINELTEKLRKRDFKIIRSVQRVGLAKMKKENPLIVRIIARKK
jgi:tellurite methyltransferase